VDDKGGVEGLTTLTTTRRFDDDCTDDDATTEAQWLRSLSFDAANGRVLIMSGRKQHEDDSVSVFSLISAPVCHECAHNGTDYQVYFVDAQVSPSHFKVRPFSTFFYLTVRKRVDSRRPVSVRLSVRLSVTLVYCIKTAKDVKLFLGLVEPSF